MEIGVCKQDIRPVNTSRPEISPKKRILIHEIGMRFSILFKYIIKENRERRNAH